LGYLNKWEKTVSNREGYKDEEKSSILLSTETSTGMKLTGEALQLHNHVQLIIIVLLKINYK